MDHSDNGHATHGDSSQADSTLWPVAAGIGALLLGVINQGMSICGLDNNWQYVIKGAVLLLAVIFDVVSNHKTGKA